MCDDRSRARLDRKRRRNPLKNLESAMEIDGWSETAEDAVLKALHCARRRHVIAPPRLHEPERRAERGDEASPVVTRDRQAAAFFRAVGGEGRKDRVAARPERFAQALDIGGPVRRIDEEVERRPVVPEVVGALRRPFRSVRDEPMNLPPRLAEPRLGRCDRRRRDVEDGHVLVAVIDQPIDEARRPAADVDDRAERRSARARENASTDGADRPDTS